MTLQNRPFVGYFGFGYECVTTSKAQLVAVNIDQDPIGTLDTCLVMLDARFIPTPVGNGLIFVPPLPI